MDEKEALEAACVADPDNETPRLVFADWLQEQDNANDHARAEYLRLQWEIERAEFAGLPDENFAELYRRSKVIEKEWADRWLEEANQCHPIPGGEWDSFYRGLPVGFKVRDLPTFLSVIAGINQTEACGGLAALQLLDLNNTPLIDLAPLSGLTRLRGLYLFKTSVTDVWPISGMTQLWELQLDETQVANLEPLEEFSELRRLRLNDTPVADLAPLASLARLRELGLYATDVVDVGPLAGLLNLRRLNLGWTAIRDIGPLSGLCNLRELYLEDTNATDLAVARLREALPGCEIDF